VDLHPDVPADVYRPRPGVVDTRQDDAQHANR
jgi:hypothetical protein